MRCVAGAYALLVPVLAMCQQMPAEKQLKEATAVAGKWNKKVFVVFDSPK